MAAIVLLGDDFGGQDWFKDFWQDQLVDDYPEIVGGFSEAVPRSTRILEGWRRDAGWGHLLYASRLAPRQLGDYGDLHKRELNAHVGFCCYDAFWSPRAGYRAVASAGPLIPGGGSGRLTTPVRARGPHVGRSVWPIQVAYP
jgi:hypothetical protein